MARENTPAISTRCKEAFNKVVAVNIVKENVDDIRGLIGNITAPHRGLFSIKEATIMRKSLQQFINETDGILEKKFREFGTVLDDCIKRETRSKLPFT